MDIQTAYAGDERITFELVRSDRRSVAVCVLPDGAVRVRAPRRTRADVIARIVAERAGWIARKRAEGAALAERRLPPLAAADIAEAKRVFAGRLDACWDVFGRPGESMPELRVRAMRSRWGSLSPHGRMTLNAQLVRAPQACLDAVVFHELCHLRVRGHGPDFYRELARYVPEWKARRAELRGLL